MNHILYTIVRKGQYMSVSTGEAAIHQELARDREPSVQVVEIIAELEGKELVEMTPAYHHLGDVLEEIFSNPPVQEAEVEITFSYEGYRITIKQDGSAHFIKKS